MDWFGQWIYAAWGLLQSMAFWLLAGFLIAGLVGEFLPLALVERHLAKRSWRSVLKAVVLGIPLPICSCGVIPVSAALREAGASKGAVAAFTAATPQTGVDSLATTYGLMGLPFMLGRLCADVLFGLMAGLLINVYERFEKTPKQVELSGGCGCCGCDSDGASPAESSMSCCSDGEASRPVWYIRVLRRAWIELPGKIGVSLFAGICMGAALAVWIPADWIQTYLGGSWWLSYLVITLLSIPVYACSVGSIPVALGLLSIGVSPGAVIVFLVTGPATNIVTISTLYQLIGRGATMIYLLSLIGGAWLVGFVFDASGVELSERIAGSLEMQHAGGEVAAFVLIVVWLNAMCVAWLKRRF